MNKKSGPDALVVLIQIQGTEFHVDKDVRSIWKVSEVKDFDDILVPSITQLFDCP